MGGNRINILIASVVMLALAIWGVSFILTLQDPRHQFAIMGVIGVGFTLLTVKQEIPIDGKMMILLVFGYFIGGKGFAYVSPYPPVYIGEIFFVMAVFGFVWRSNLNLVNVCKMNAINTLIIIACVCGGFRALLDFKQFGMLAIRDSAMIYYSFLAVTTCVLCQNEKFNRLFLKLLPYAVVLGMLSYLFKRMGGAAAIHQLVPLSQKLYSPHADVTVPIIVCVSMMGFQLLKKRPLAGGLMLLMSLAVMATDKTAFLFCFVFTALLLATVGKMRMIIGVGSAMVLLGVLGLMFFSIFDNNTTDFLTDSDVAGTLDAITQIEGAGDKGTTTAWRTEWWRIVFRDTYNESPIMGLGLGSDITANFMREYMSIEVPEQHQFSLTRYPHNIVFTVFGRLGFVGLLCFTIYAALFVKFCWNYSKFFIARRDRLLIDVLLLGFVFAGFCNAFVQSTYENPYAGIPHWVCLGAMMARYSIKKKEAQINRENRHSELENRMNS